MTYVTCRLSAKNRDQLWNPTLGNRVWATFTFLHYKVTGLRLAASATDHGQAAWLHHQAGWLAIPLVHQHPCTWPIACKYVLHKTGST